MTLLAGDWYVKDRAGNNYEKSSDYVRVRARQSSTIRNLKKKEYRIVFAYEDQYGDLEEYQYTPYVYLDEDIVYSILDRTFYGRSNNSSEPEFYITDSKGNVYPLQKVEE